MWYSWVVFFHIITASAFVFVMLMMQILVSNIMKRIPESPGKESGKSLIKDYLHPVVDAVILIVGITGVILVIATWPLAVKNFHLTLKIAFAVISLGAAYTGHFILRPLKKKWTKQGNRTALEKAARISPFIDRTALIAGVITALLGWSLNHL